MGYVLGIDLGDTRTSAAVTRREGDTWTDPEPASLHEGHSPDGAVPTALHVGADGSVLVGQAANATAPADPQRVARGFVSRVGDPVPVVLAEGPYPAEVLAATVVGWVADEVAAAEGTRPDRIALAYPPYWGAHRCAALHAALEDAGLAGVVLTPSAVAVAQAYSAHGHVDSDSLVAVGRLGGAHVDGAVLRARRAGFELALPAVRPPSPAGTRIDDLLSDHADSRLVLRTALAALWRCFSAAPVGEPATVLLAGGSAHSPLVREFAEEVFGDKVAIGPDPGSAVCRGAALVARPCPAPARPQPPHPRAEGRSTELVGYSRSERALAARGDAPSAAPPPRPAVEVSTLRPPRRGAKWRRGRGKDGRAKHGKDGA